MKLSEYIKEMPKVGRKRGARQIADATGYDVRAVHAIASGKLAPSPTKALLIEAITHGRVSRFDLRHDASKLWPEMAKLKGLE